MLAFRTVTYCTENEETLNGHYTFQSDGKMIDLDALVAGLELG
ncbi:hypothetical protein ACHFCA_27650 [Delftia tsuruhatensis]